LLHNSFVGLSAKNGRGLAIRRYLPLQKHRAQIELQESRKQAADSVLKPGKEGKK